MMVYFRERIDKNLVNQVNKKMVKNLREKTEEIETESEANKKKPETELEETKNKGKLILDATAATARHNLS